MVGLMRVLGTGIMGGLMGLLEREDGLEMKREVETYLDRKIFLMPEYKKIWRKRTVGSIERRSEVREIRKFNKE